jgi:hypothetical protein
VWTRKPPRSWENPLDAQQPLSRCVPDHAARLSDQGVSTGRGCERICDLWLCLILRTQLFLPARARAAPVLRMRARCTTAPPCDVRSRGGEVLKLVAALAVIAIAAGFTVEGRDSSAPVVDRRAALAGGPVRSDAGADQCRAARKSLRWYMRHAREWRERMGAGAGRYERSVRDPACPRYLSKLWRSKAQAARAQYVRWFEYHWNWRRWLPANWRALGACETGYGREPGSWTWDSGDYVSAFGIYEPGYRDDARRIGNFGWEETKQRLGRLPSPREQFEAAKSHLRTHGDGWGCPGP